MEFEVLKRPVNMGRFQEGMFYDHIGFASSVPSSKSSPNTFLDIYVVDEVYIKIPTVTYGYMTKAYFDEGKIDFSNTWRTPQWLEDRERFAEALNRFPEIRQAYELITSSAGYHHEMRSYAYWSIIHKVNYMRIKEIMKVPVTNFVNLRTQSDTVIPAVVQERIHGTRLWDMYDHSIRAISPRWQRYLYQISDQLGHIVCSDDMCYFDFNIMNFIWNENQEVLYYVDPKPSWFTKLSIKNLRGIEDFFLIGDWKKALHTRIKRLEG